MTKEEKKEEKKLIIAVYKVNLHCPKCAHDIRKPLLRTPGVHSVDVKFESSEITVKGAIEAKKIQQLLEKWSRRTVIKIKESAVEEKATTEKDKETKKEIIKTTVKAYMHCDQCERDLRKKLIKHKGIHNVTTDKKAQTITVEGILEAEKVVSYIQKSARKHAEIVALKEKKEEKKEKVTIEAVKTPEITKVIEFEKEKKVEVKTKEGTTPYFVHYVYAPQLFSDENPNACSVM